MPHFVLGAMGDMVRGQLKDTKEPLPFMPAARIGGLARWDNGRYSLGGEVRHGFKQDRVPAATTEDDPSALATDAFTIVNLSASLNLPFGDRVHALTLRVDNVGNTKYRDATSRIKTFAFNPGRNVSLIYRVLF
jgi:iron complex outermembrane receptor protein